MNTWRPDDDDSDLVIDREWRKASREEPPQHVDAAILAAARTRRPWFATWQPLAAAAAVAGLAFLLVQLLPSERKLEQPIRMESQQRSQSAPEPGVAPPQEPAETAVSRSDAALEPPQSSRESRADDELAAGATAPAATAERADARANSSAIAPPTVEMRPAQWATLIETLYASGDLATAAAQLRAFRIEHLDADRYLPEALREWASTVE